MVLEIFYLDVNDYQKSKSEIKLPVVDELFENVIFTAQAKLYSQDGIKSGKIYLYKLTNKDNTENNLSLSKDIKLVLEEGNLVITQIKDNTNRVAGSIFVNVADKKTGKYIDKNVIIVRELLTEDLIKFSILST